jgi:hypothetical protein
MRFLLILEPTSKMTTMTLIMGHECKWGPVWVHQQEGRGKERLLRGEEDGSRLHICIRCQHKETHQRCDQVGRWWGDGNITEECMELSQWKSLTVLMYDNSKFKLNQIKRQSAEDRERQTSWVLSRLQLPAHLFVRCKLQSACAPPGQPVDC